MAQFVTHIQPTLVEASHHHVPHHHKEHHHHTKEKHDHHKEYYDSHHHHKEQEYQFKDAVAHASHPREFPVLPGVHHDHHGKHEARDEAGGGSYVDSHGQSHSYQLSFIDSQGIHRDYHGHEYHKDGERKAVPPKYIDLQPVYAENKASDGNTSFLRAARAGHLDKVLEHLKQNIDINTSNANGLNALHLASKDGHVEVVAELLRRGANVDAATKKGNTALHIASLAGQEEVVKLLVQHGASINVQSQNGFTPLYMAAQENHDNVVKYLLANGANQSLATEDGFTPVAVAMQQGHDKVVAVLLENDSRGKVRLPALHIAAKKDDVKAAKLLLDNDHNPDVTSKSAFTPLHIASHYGNEAVANLLIQKGADVNYAAKHNITPLHVAAKWGKANMVSLLVDKGANIESKTRDGLTPLHCAARSGHEQVVEMLLERGAPISSKTKNGLAPLHMAAQGDHVEAARKLLNHRAPVDEVTVDYLTALHVAAHCGHVRVAKLLLDRGADANARALNGFTPLHIACKKNRIKVVELLLKHGACISATTESGLTPLHVASFMGCMNIVIYLLQHDANPDVPTVRGETPLHLAARANQSDIIRILLRNGAQVDARAREQQTPLHIASRLGNVDIVMMLLQHGAKVDTTTKDMYTALHIAAKEGQDEVAAALIDNGASLNATSKKGFTPLHLAAKYGNIKVAKLLLQKEAPVDAQGKNGVTPLHVASHYDHQNVALLLLEKGASPHATAKNGHTPLHIAARKNQMDIANTLLEYGAQPNAESKAGFTPLHLSSQEGHGDMSALLIEHKADVNYPSKNGLMPLHLCAQEDRVPVAEILVKNGAEVDAITRDGYTPLHIAGHYGQANMVRFLLAHGANVQATTSIGYTPLHQAAQQGHTNIVNILLENSADPNAVTMNGQTPLQIAQKLGYITVIDTLKVVTTTTTTVNVEEKYRVVAPEGMHETFMSDSEEEGGEDTMLGDHTYRYLTADEMKSLGDDSLPIDVTRDERIDSNRMVTSGDSNILPPQTIEESFSPIHMQQNYVEYVKKYAPDNVDLGMQKNVGFLVSFLVDARGGAMRGCRHSGVRVIVPPRCAQSPTRITCRYVRPQRTPHPPPLMEGEALASRVLELGPVGAKFLGPVVIEIPHFAALRGKEREIVILRSDNGESWKEHQVDAAEEVLNNVLHDSFEADDLNQMEDTSSGRITRIVTQDFPQYFAVVSRVRQEVHAIGPEGGMVSSTVVPQVQAVFPQGALTKKIKVGLQAQPIDPELTAKLLGHGVAVSPVVTVEPRRRKFHKAITLSMPAPRAHSQGMINQYSGSAPTLRLLCSITGGTSRAQWEDVTGSTPLTFVNDCVSFTTTVSARFWLMDCRNIGDATKMATELYREVIHVPFMAKFVVFAKRIDVLEARLRVFCMTDDKEDKTLEHQEHFTEIAKSRDVEVLEGKSQYIEFAGNLVPITKSGEQLQFSFRAFRENRLPFSVRVKDQHAEAVGRALFMKEPKVPKGEPPQQPICILNIVLPEDIVSETVSLTDTDSLKHSFLKENYDYCRPDPRLADVSNLLGEDWVALANQLGLTTSEINVIKSEYPESVAKQAQSMLRMWISQSGNKAQGNTLENALRRIGREDIIPQCLNVDERLEKVRKDELGRSRKDYFDEDDDDRKARKLDKYSAEEKIVVETSEEEEEDFNKTVTERRQQIEKRLSVDRTIPASSQRVEIVQEISSIKRQSLVEDKILEVEQKAKTVTKAEKTTPPTDGIEAVSTIKTTEERTEIKPTRKVEIQSDRRDSDLLEGVTQILETQKTVTVIRQTEVEPKTPMFSKTPPPSPADFILREQAASIQGWDAERKGPMSPKGAALTEEAMQKGKPTSTTKPLTETKQVSLDNALDAQVVDKGKKPISRESSKEDLSKSDDRKPKKGFFGAIKTFVAKSLESDSESESSSKSPKKQRKEKKKKSKSVDVVPEEAPPRPPRKPKLPTPTQERKEYADIPFATTPDNLDEELETVEEKARQIVSEVISESEQTTNKIKEKKAPLSVEEVIIEKHFQPVVIETEEISVVVDPTKKEPEKKVIETFTVNLDQSIEGIEKELLEEPPILPEETILKPVVDLDAPLRPPRTKHIYEEIEEPVVSQPPDHLVTEPLYIEEDIENIKKITTNLISNEQNFEGWIDVKQHDQPKEVVSELATEKKKKKEKGFFSFLGKKPSKDTYESDDDSKQEIIEKQDKEMSKEKSIEVKEKKKQESEDESEESKKGGFLGLFAKKPKKEDSKSLEQVQLSPEVLKNMEESSKFLKDEVANYETGPVVKSAVDVVEDIQETIEVKELPKIAKDERDKTPEKKLKKKVSDDESEESKKGFLGLFGKKSKKEETKSEKTETTDDTVKFLNGETENYETGLVEQKTIVEPSAIPEDIKKETVEITKKDKTKSPEKKLKKRDESEDESEEGKKSGLLGLFGKKSKKEEVKPVRIELSSEVKKDMDDSNNFLSVEIENYETGLVAPNAVTEPSEIKDEIKKETVEITKKEKTRSPEKKLKKRDESEDESEEGKKSGLLGLFGKKTKKEEVKPVKIELSSEVKKDMDDSNKFLNLEIENYESGRVEHKIVTEPTVITEEIKKETVVIIKKEKAKSPEKKLKKRDESEDESEEGKKSGLLSLFAKKTKKEEVKPVKIELSSEVKTDVEDTNKFLNLEIENYETGPVEHQFITEPSVTTEEIKKETVEITKKEKAKSPEKKLKKRDESEDESEEGKKSGLLGLFGKKTKKEEVKPVKIELSSEVKKDIDDSNKFLSTEIENYETGPVEKNLNASEEIMKVEIVEKIEKPQKKERTKSPEKKLKKRDESEEEKTGLLSFFSKKPKKEEEVKVVELSPEVLQNMKATNEFLNGEVENYETGPVIKNEEAQKLGETKIFGKKEHKMSPEKKLKKREESEDESDESKKTSLFGLFGKKSKKEEVKPEKVEEDSTKFLNGEKAKYETDLVEKAESIVKSEKVNVETSKEVTKSVEKKAEVEKLILSKELLSNMEDSTNFLKTERDNYESGPVIKKTEITPLAAATEPEKVSKEQKKERTKSPEKKPKKKEETEEQKEEAKRKGLLGLFGKKPKKEDVKSIKTEMSPQFLQDMEDSTKFLNGEVENYESGPVEKKLEAPIEAEIGETKIVSELQETAKPTKKERTKSPEKKIKKVDDKSEDESGESKGILGFFGKKQKKEELKAEKQELSEELLQNMQSTTDFLLTEVKNYECGPVEKKPVIEEVTKTVRIEETPKLAEKTKSKSLERKKKEESVDEDEDHKKGGFLGLFGKKSKKEEPQTLPESVILSEEVLQHMEDSKSFLTDEVKNYESGPVVKTDSPKASEVIVETKKSTKASETPKLPKREKSKSLERQKKGDSEDEGDESKKPGFLGLFTKKSKKEEVHEKAEDTEDLLKSIEDSKLFLNQEISNYETGLVEKKHKIRSERPLSEEVKITETTPKMQQKREKSTSLERTKKDETGDESDGKKASFLALFGKKTKKQEQPQKIILSDELLKSMDDTKLFLTEEIKNYETGPVEKNVIQETEIVVASAPIQEETKKTPKLSKKEKSKSLDRKKLQESENEGEESKKVGFLERFGIKTKKAETTQEIADTSEEILKLKEESKTFLSEEVKKYESGPVEKKLSEGPAEVIEKEQKAQKTEKVTIPFFKERSKSPEKKLKKTDVSDDEGESRTKGGLLGLFAKKTTKEEVTHEPSEELKKNMSQTTDFLKTEIANYETGLYIKPSIHKVETEIIPTKEAPKSEQPQDDSTQNKSKESPKKKEKKLKKKQESDDESEEKKVGFLGLFGKKSKKEEPKEIELSKELIENMSNTTEFLRLEVENYESGPLIIKTVKTIEIDVPIEESKVIKVKEEPEVHTEKVAKADKESKKHPEVVEESDESKKVGFFGLFGKKQKKDTVKEPPKTELSEEVLQNMKDTTDFLQVEVKNYESGPVDKKIVEPETVQTETVTTVEEVSKDKIKKRDKKGKKREDSEDESEDRKSGFFGLFGKKPKKEDAKVETKDKVTEIQKKEDEKEVSSKQKAEAFKPEKREKSPEKEATKKQESEDEMTKKSLLGISDKKGTKEEENELKTDKPETVTDAQPQQVVSESTITQQEFEKYDIPAPVAEEIFEGLVATSGPAVVEHTRKVIVSTKETVGEVDHIPDEFLDQIQDGETLKSELHTRVFEKEIVIQKEIITKDNEIVKKEITIKESLPVGEGDFVREEVTVSKSDEPKPQDLFAASLKQTEQFLSTEIKNFDDVIQRKPVKEPVEQNVEKTTEETPKSKSKKLKTDEKSVASESEEKKGLFGLFGKKSKQEEEKIKSTKQPISETKVESIDETKGFLDEEVKRHDDVYASKTVEKEEAAPAKQPEEKSEPTVEQKKGFFGLFSKKQKTQDHEDKKPQTEETTVEPVQESEIIKPSSIMPDSKLPKQELVSFTNSFIDEERKQYEGMGITRCKPVVEAQVPIETKTGILGTLKKKFRLSSESGGEEIEEKIEETAVKAAEVAKESRQRKKSGSPFRIFAKRTKSQEREIKSPETELEDTKKQISETDNFLNEEISGYHDVRPTSIDLSKIKDDKLESVAKDEDEEMKPILNRGKSEDIHEPIAALSAEVLKDMLDTKNFLSKEVEVYEDAKPVSKDTEEESEEESSSKSSGLFSIFSKKDVKQSPSAPRKKHKKKKKQETKSPPATKSPKKGGFFSKIGEKVASKFEGAASEVKEVVDETQDGLKQKSKKVKGFAEEELERAKSSIEETKTTIKDGVEQGQKKTIDAAKNADEKLSTIKNGLEESKNLIVEDIEKQTSELKAASDASLQLAKDKLHETKSAVDEELQKTKDNLDDLKSSTVETLDKTKEASQVKSKQVEAAFEDQLTKVKDTLETKLTEAKDSVKSGLEAEKKAAEEKVQQAADVIDESFALGKDKLAKAKDEMEAKKSSLKSDLQGKLHEGEKSVKDAKTAFDDGLTKAEVKMEDTLTGITSVTESIKTGAAEKIHEGKLAVEDEAKKTKGVIEKGLMEGKQQLDEAKSQIDAHKKSIEESAEKSKSKIDETFTDIKGAIFGIKSEIKDKVDTSKKAIEEKSKDATTTIDDKLSSTQHEIEKRKESITTEIAHKLDDAKKAVDDKIKETKAKVETSIQDAKTDIGHKRDSGKAAVADKTEQANQLAKEVISSTKDQLQKAKNEIETTKKSVAQGIAQKHDEVKDKSKEAKTIAEQSIGVAQEKLTDVQEGIKEKVVSVTKSAEDKIKDAKIEADKAKQQIEASKDKISSDIQQKVGEVKEDIKEKIHATEEKLSGVKSKVELKAEEGKATLDSKAMEAMKKVDEVVITAKDKIQESKDKVDATKEDMKAKIAEEKKATDEKVKKAKGVAEETVIQAKGKLTQIKSEVEQKVEETKKDVEQKKKNLQTSAEEYVSETKEKLKDAESKIKAKTETIVSETEQKLEESKKMADEKAKQAKSALDSSIKSAKDQLADTKSEAAKKSEDTKKVLEEKSIEAKDSIESFKSGVAGMFADGKKAAQVKFEDTTAETEKCLFEARQVVEDKSKGAKALIDSKVESAKSATESFIEKEKKEVEDRREHAKSILKDVKSDVESKVEDGKKSLEEGKKEAKSVVDLAKEKSEEAKTVVSSSISTLKGKAEDTISAGTAKAQDKVDGIKDKVDASLSSVRDEVKIAEDKIQSLNSGIKDESDKVKATVSEKLQEASSAMHETESKMKEGFTRIDEKFKDTKGVFEKSISDAISKTKEECEQGLLQKMDDSKQTIEKKVQDTKSSFSETVTSSKAKAEDKEKDFTSTIEHQFSQLLDDVKSEVDTIKTQKEQASSKLTSAEKDFQSRAHSLQTSVETKGSDVASNLSEVIDKEIANIEKSLQSIGGSSALQKGDKSQTPKAFEASLLESLDQVLEETKIQSTKAEREPEKESLFDILVQDIKGGKPEQPEIVTDLDDVRRSFSGELPQETLEALQAVDKQKADVVKLVQEQTASFSGKLDDEFESLDSDFLGRMKRTVSDFSGTKKKSDGNECTVNISETNIDLSSLPPMESEKRVSKQKEKGSSPYITSPTMSRRSVSQRLPKGERPELLDVTNMPLDSSSDDEQYIVTTPTDDKGTESRKRRPLFHIESEDDDSFDHDKRQDSVKSNVLETLSEATLETLVTNLGAESVDVEKDKGFQKVEEDSKVDVETIEQKLRDLDAALGSLESLEAQESKKEAKLKRVERKFERMASEALEKDETDKLTTPEVEEKRDTEFRTLVSQLSTEEISDFQKDYATLWDDQTFSRSEEMESKTPDSQAEIQELPKGEIVYMAPVNLNKDTLVNKAGIEVDVIPIMRSPCASPRHRRKKRKTARAKSEIAFGKSALNPEEDRGSLPDLDHYKNTPLKGSLMELVQTNPDRFLNRSCISGSTESLVSSIVSEDRMARSLGSSESLSRGAIMNAVVNWLHKSSPLGSLDNLDSGSNASLLTTSDVQDSETSRSCAVPEIFVSDVKGQVRSSKYEKRREPCLLSQSPLGDGSWQSSPATASDVLGATPRRPQDESKQGTSQQKASDQHQLSEEMKELLKEMEKDSKK